MRSKSVCREGHSLMYGVDRYDVRVGRIGRPHGIRGEVTVEVFTDSPEIRFTPGSELQIQAARGASPQFTLLTVEKFRWNKKILLLKFREFSDRNTAESMRNFELYSAVTASVDDGEGWYAEELIGLVVYENSLNSEKIGVVSELIAGETQDLLEIRLNDGSEVLVPFVEEIVPEIHAELGAVVITPPPGLLELN